jgi:uncharacterized membrane protein (UPF0127 family)
MKGIALLLLGLVALGGCQTTPPAEPPPQTNLPTAVGEDKPTTSMTDPASKPPLDSQTTKPSLAKHPERIHALEDLAVVKLKANGHWIDAWVMDNDSKREEGMMYLTSADVKENQGMIFVFPAERPQESAFWMHDTPIPLDIIYIGTNHKVVNVGVGKPFSDAQVKATGKYGYVLELKQGTAAKFGIRGGTLVEIPGSLKTSE